MDQRLNFQRHPAVSDAENGFACREACALCRAEFWGVPQRWPPGQGSVTTPGCPGEQRWLVGLHHAHVSSAPQPGSPLVSSLVVPRWCHVSVGMCEAAVPLSRAPQSSFHRDEAGGGVSLVVETATAPGMQKRLPRGNRPSCPCLAQMQCSSWW